MALSNPNRLVEILAGKTNLQLNSETAKDADAATFRSPFMVLSDIRQFVQLDSYKQFPTQPNQTAIDRPSLPIILSTKQEKTLETVSFDRLFAPDNTLALQFQSIILRFYSLQESEQNIIIEQLYAMFLLYKPSDLERSTMIGVILAIDPELKGMRSFITLLSQTSLQLDKVFPFEEGVYKKERVQKFESLGVFYKNVFIIVESLNTIIESRPSTASNLALANVFGPVLSTTLSTNLTMIWSKFESARQNEYFVQALTVARRRLGGEHNLSDLFKPEAETEPQTAQYNFLVLLSEASHEEWIANWRYIVPQLPSLFESYTFTKERKLGTVFQLVRIVLEKAEAVILEKKSCTPVESNTFLKALVILELMLRKSIAEYPMEESALLSLLGRLNLLYDTVHAQIQTMLDTRVDGETSSLHSTDLLFETLILQKNPLDSYQPRVGERLLGDIEYYHRQEGQKPKIHDERLHHRTQTLYTVVEYATAQSALALVTSNKEREKQGSGIRVSTRMVLELAVRTENKDFLLAEVSPSVPAWLPLASALRSSDRTQIHASQDSLIEDLIKLCYGSDTNALTNALVAGLDARAISVELGNGALSGRMKHVENMQLELHQKEGVKQLRSHIGRVDKALTAHGEYRGDEEHAMILLQKFETVLRQTDDLLFNLAQQEVKITLKQLGAKTEDKLRRVIDIAFLHANKLSPEAMATIGKLLMVFNISPLGENMITSTRMKRAFVSGAIGHSDVKGHAAIVNDFLKHAPVDEIIELSTLDRIRPAEGLAHIIARAVEKKNQFDINLAALRYDAQFKNLLKFVIEKEHREFSADRSKYGRGSTKSLMIMTCRFCEPNPALMSVIDDVGARAQFEELYARLIS